VALCTTRSTPSGSARRFTGEAKVASNTDRMARRRQAAATAGTSTTRSVGLVGLSKTTARAFAGADSTAAARPSSGTVRISTPKRSSTSRARRVVWP
jgi:hypothetical protein